MSNGNTNLQQAAPPTTAVQRKYDPLSPIGDASALKGLMESQKRSLAEMLPKHITPERLFKTMLVAANRNPDIFQCTQTSILETINRAAELGLDLSGTLGEAYPVPFNNKVKSNGQEVWVKQCQLIIGYRGMEKLAWQSGEVESIDAEVVYINDKFTFRKGTEVFVQWEPCMVGERGEPIGAYACVKMKSGGKLARFLTLADIEKIRKSSKSADSPAWRNWWSEMARKCVLKRTLKDAPLSTEKFVSAMDTDAEDFTEDVLRVDKVGKSSADVVAEKVRAKLIQQQPAEQPPVNPDTGEEGSNAEPQTEAASNPVAETPTASSTDPEPMSALEQFHATLNETAETLGVDKAAAGQWWKNYVLAKGFKGKEDKLTGPQLQVAITAFAEEHKKG